VRLLCLGRPVYFGWCDALVTRNLKAVILDLDGTIVPFNLDYRSARAEVIDFLGSQGFPRSLFSLNESVFEMLKKVEVSMKNQNKSDKDFSEVKKAILALLEKYEMKSASSNNLIPGMAETLRALKKMKLKLALFTVNSEKSTNHILDTFHLRQFFDAVITRDSVSFVKPNPVHLQMVLKVLKVKPEEAVVVGDSVWDMKSAQELNVFAVGTLSGVSSAKQLTQAGANCLISSPLDLITLIEELNKVQNEKNKKAVVA
jgi:phosphoglycolate phosphatase